MASLNHGLSLCRGELIARLDADDWALPTRLARQVAEFDARPELVLCASPYERVDPSGRLIRVGVPPPTHASLAMAMLVGNRVLHSTTMFRRDAVIGVGGYDPSDGFPSRTTTSGFDCCQSASSAHWTPRRSRTRSTPTASRHGSPRPGRQGARSIAALPPGSRRRDVADDSEPATSQRARRRPRSTLAAPAPPAAGNQPRRSRPPSSLGRQHGVAGSHAADDERSRSWSCHRESPSSVGSVRGTTSRRIHGGTARTSQAGLTGATVAQHLFGRSSSVGAVNLRGMVRDAVARARQGNLGTVVVNRIRERRNQPRRLLPHAAPTNGRASSRRVNRLVAELGASRYLEVGVKKGVTLETVTARERTAVDPAPMFDTRHLPAGVRVYCGTSDDFFATIGPEDHVRSCVRRWAPCVRAGVPRCDQFLPSPRRRPGSSSSMTSYRTTRSRRCATRTSRHGAAQSWTFRDKAGMVTCSSCWRS